MEIQILLREIGQTNKERLGNFKDFIVWIN